MSTKKNLIVVSLLALAFPVAAQKNCNGTSTGMIPLIDLGKGTYKTYPGGLYPGGVNTMPAAHAAAGLAEAKAVQPLDAAGKASANGRIGVVSVGMSNTTQLFSAWVPISYADPNRSAAVTVVDCAQSGQHAAILANPSAKYWQVANARLQMAGVTAQQVQVAWLNEAMWSPTKPFPAHARELRNLLAKICQNLKAKYPNLRICYVSSRIYGGYTGTKVNPEPYAYEAGLAVRWLIEGQINGNPILNFNPKQGRVNSPWLAWGPYMWADGIKPRSDGLSYVCSDLTSDGLHPATGAQQKVAKLLDAHFTTDPTSKPWYVGPAGSKQAYAAIYGQACAGSKRYPYFQFNSFPRLGNTNLVLKVGAIPSSSLTLLLLSTSKALLPVEQCVLLVDPNQILLGIPLMSSSTGNSQATFSVPNDPGLIGAAAYAQWVIEDSQSSNLKLMGGGSATRGLELRIGN